MGRVDGKVVLISGVARGQGRSHACMLAAEGADIIGIDLCDDIETNHYPLASRADLDETTRLVEKQGRTAFMAVADVRDRKALESVIDDAVAQFGHLDVVVANAGICPMTRRLPNIAFVDAVDVDLIGVINLVHASLRHLKSGASIVATGSMGAFLASMASSFGPQEPMPGGRATRLRNRSWLTTSTTWRSRWRPRTFESTPSTRRIATRHAAQPTDIRGTPTGSGKPDP